MKIALITDTHWGARGDNNAFAEYFNQFYYDYFFPYLKDNGIDTIVHLGDICDRRKYINYVTARHLRKFVSACADNELKLHVIIGNHDTFYKNTNDVNCMNELFEHSEHKNKTLFYYSDAKTVNMDGLDISFLPWICAGNFDDSMEYLENTKAQVLFGHLEIAGFEMYRGSVSDHGFDSKLFDKFDVVCSGHFHHKSTRGNINYLGAPYEITWLDWNDDRGFHVFDTDTRQLTFIKNPYRMFHKIYYDDLNKTLDEITAIDTNAIRGSYVKVVIRNKTNPYWFDMFIDKIEKSGVLDLQVVEDNLNLQLEDDDDIASEAEDTLTMLKKAAHQVGANWTDSKQNKLNNFLTDLYGEALTLE